MHTEASSTSILTINGKANILLMTNPRPREMSTFCRLEVLVSSGFTNIDYGYVL